MLGAASRYARRGVVCPPCKNEEAQLEFLRHLALQQGLRGWVLFPTTDDMVALVGKHHEFLAKFYRLTTPPWTILRWGCDKRLLHQLATDLGIASPPTFCPRDRKEVEVLPCTFPSILKPAMRLGSNRLSREKAWRVEDRAELLARYDEACRIVPHELLMVQEVLPGGGESQFSYAALCRNGQPLASMMARRLRQFPMEFGRFSTYVESIDEPPIAEAAARLLAAMQFTGLVEVEFKRDPRDGKFKVLDVNPRVWGWHTLGRRAGVDFPYLAWRLVNGEDVVPVCGRPGAGWFRLGADFPMALQEIFRRRLSIASYLKSLWSSPEWATFAWDDPLPGVAGLPIFFVMAARHWYTRGSV